MLLGLSLSSNILVIFCKIFELGYNISFPLAMSICNENHSVLCFKMHAGLYLEIKHKYTKDVPHKLSLANFIFLMEIKKVIFVSLCVYNLRLVDFKVQVLLILYKMKGLSDVFPYKYFMLLVYLS